MDILPSLTFSSKSEHLPTSGYSVQVQRTEWCFCKREAVEPFPLEVGTCLICFVYSCLLVSSLKDNTHPHKDIFLASYRIQILRKPKHLKLFPAALTCLTADSRGTSGLASERQRQTRRRRWKQCCRVTTFCGNKHFKSPPRKKTYNPLSC